MNATKSFNLLTLILIILVLALPVLAQDTPTEAPAPLGFEAFVQLGGISLLVTSIVALSKKIPLAALQNFSSARLAGLISLVLFVAYRLVVAFDGDSELFISKLSDFGQIGEYLVGILVTFAAATGNYHVAKNLGIPMLGASKSVAAEGNERPGL